MLVLNNKQAFCAFCTYNYSFQIWQYSYKCSITWPARWQQVLIYQTPQPDGEARIQQPAFWWSSLTMEFGRLHRVNGRMLHGSGFHLIKVHLPLLWNMLGRILYRFVMCFNMSIQYTHEILNTCKISKVCTYHDADYLTKQKVHDAKEHHASC